MQHLTPDELWEAVRAAYPRQEPLLNLNNAAVSPSPLAVEAAVVDAIRLIGRNPDVNMWSKLDAALPQIKAELAQVADCDTDEIALNRNSSEGLATSIFGIPLDRSDEVLVCEWDYPSVRAAWFQRAQREGIRVVTVNFDTLQDDEAIFQAYAQAITPRTRVMQITHMLHWNGRLLPAQRLCALARQHGVVTVVDGAQTFAQMPVSFREMGCDYFATSLHKWLGAPVGNGMLIVRRDRIDTTWPLLGPFDAPPLGIDKFDHWNLGTYNSALQTGIARAIELHRRIGAAKMHARLRELTRYWIAQARTIPGFALHTPLEGEGLGALSLFSIEGVDAKVLERELRETHKVHVKHRCVRHLEGLRVSPHVYMTTAELDRFVDVLGRSVRCLRAKPVARARPHSVA
jgi:selenocysteine lyase/cysteine desulfurase